MSIFDPRQPSGTNPYNSGVAGSYGLYNTAVEQQAGDYGNIMSGYKNLPNTPGYQNLADLSKTGGYSDQNIADIRARSVSPIRSIYSSAQQNVERQKALQGGYSPNYGAVQAKMARDESQQVSDANTNVNATIAQNIAQNRIGLAPQFAQSEATPLQGQQSLYGTTPALSSTFGNQALEAADLQNRINQAPAVGYSGYGGYPYAGAGGMRPANAGYSNMRIGIGG